MKLDKCCKTWYDAARILERDNNRLRVALLCLIKKDIVGYLTSPDPLTRELAEELWKQKKEIDDFRERYSEYGEAKT